MVLIIEHASKEFYFIFHHDGSGSGRWNISTSTNVVTSMCQVFMTLKSVASEKKSQAPGKLTRASFTVQV